MGGYAYYTIYTLNYLLKTWNILNPKILKILDKELWIVPGKRRRTKERRENRKKGKMGEREGQRDKRMFSWCQPFLTSPLRLFLSLPFAGEAPVLVQVTAIQWLPSLLLTAWTTRIDLSDQMFLKVSEHSHLAFGSKSKALQGLFIILVSELRTWERSREKRWKKNYFENLPNSGFFHTPLP